MAARIARLGQGARGLRQAIFGGKRETGYSVFQERCTIVGVKLATLREGGRDGSLLVVDAEGLRFLRGSVAGYGTLQAALDDWGHAEPKLRALSEELEAGSGEPLEATELAAPLPRAYEWIDGSAYINHIELVRKARNAEPPETLRTDPLVYQGGSGVLLGPRQPVELPDPAWGLDLEGELCVILGDTPRGVSTEEAGQHVKLVTMCNDLTFRHLVPPELKKGFGFFQSKPATAFAPFAVTPDELGAAWQSGRIHLPLWVSVNGESVGTPHAGPEMHFSFFDLIAHISRTRAFTAGTIVGSGTVSNREPAAGVSCLAEKRMREIIATGVARTEFLKVGDEVAIEMRSDEGWSLFGEIRQRVVPGS